MQEQKTTKGVLRALLFATGFWAPYIFGYWIVVSTQMVAQSMWVLVYPGLLFLPLPVFLLLAWKSKLAILEKADLLMMTVGSLSVLCIVALSGVARQLPVLMMVLFVLAALVQVVMLLRWWSVFVQLDTRMVLQAFLVGLALAACAKLLVSLFPAVLNIMAFALPWLSSVFARYASGLLNEGQVSLRNSSLSPLSVRSLWRIWLSIGIFLLIWGFLDAVIARSSVDSNQANAFFVIAQVLDALFAFVMLWFYFVQKSSVEYARLWGFLYTFLAFALLTITFFDTLQIAQVFTASALPVARLLLLVGAIEVAQRTTIPVYVPCSVAELVYTSTDWIADAFVVTLGIGHLDNTVIAVLFFLSIAVLVLLLGYRNPEETSQLLMINRVMPSGDQRLQFKERCATLASEYGLTEREGEILQYLCQGRSKPYIAETLFLSENTVKSYTKNIYRKFDVHSRQELLDYVLGNA